MCEKGARGKVSLLVAGCVCTHKAHGEDITLKLSSKWIKKGSWKVWDQRESFMVQTIDNV